MLFKRKVLVKSSLAVVLSGILLMSASIQSKADNYLRFRAVYPCVQTITVNGEVLKDNSVRAVNIDGYNYFKLRDVANMLTKNGKKVGIEYNAATNTANLITGKDYEMTSSDYTDINWDDFDITESTTIIKVDGKVIKVNGYLIDSQNYFKLRDLLSELNVSVDYDKKADSILVSTKENSDTPKKTAEKEKPKKTQEKKDDKKSGGSSSKDKSSGSSSKDKSGGSSNKDKPEPKAEPTPNVVSKEEYTSEVIRLVNIEREKVGAKPLKQGGYQDYADIRAEEIKEVFSHTRPDGTSCLNFYRGMGYAGENIAWGQRTPEEVMDSWMHSDGHRENILNPKYNYICVGFNDYRWVQLFTTEDQGNSGKKPEPKPQPQPDPKPQPQPDPKPQPTKPSSPEVQSIIDKVNKKRAEYGVKEANPLLYGLMFKEEPAIKDYVQKKAVDMSSQYDEDVTDVPPIGFNKVDVVYYRYVTAKGQFASAEEFGDWLINNSEIQTYIADPHMDDLTIGISDNNYFAVFGDEALHSIAPMPSQGGSLSFQLVFEYDDYPCPTKLKKTIIKPKNTQNPNPDPNPQPQPQPDPNPQPQPQPDPKPNPAPTVNETDRVIELVNIEREKAGVSSLKKGSFQAYADTRAKEIKDVFSHTRPNGSSCLDFYRGRGYAGENIAWGQRTPEGVMNSWMNSDGHRRNILNPKYNYICVGFNDYRWVQLFTTEDQ